MEEVCARCDEQHRWLTVERGPWTIVCHLGRTPVTLRLRDGAHDLVAASEMGIIVSPPSITLLPDSVAILKQPGRD
jgi:hypothetical protein